MKHNLLSAFLSLLFCGTLTACTAVDAPDAAESTATQDDSYLAEETQTPSVSAITTLTLPYTQSDPLHPYLAQSINNITIMPLLYDSLVKIAPDFSLDYQIADELTCSSNTVRVHLRDGIVFTDGSALTATDVVYSFNKAKTSPAYQEQLSSITAASGKNQEVVFTMNAPNALAGYLLDFPIVKNRSAESADTPIGSGRYSIDSSSDGILLQYNTNHFAHGSPKFTEIELEASPSTETTEAGIKIGWYDLAYRGTAKNTMGGTGAVTQSTPVPQLLFLGINGSNPFLSNAQVRQALSAVIDRDDLLRTIYSNNGVTTTLPIYPAMPLEGTVSAPSSGVDEANRLLDETGLTQRNSYDVRYMNGTPLTLEILVSQSSPYQLMAANTISAMFNRCGIQVNVVSVSDAVYQSRIASGNYTLYIGELQQTNDCSLAPFLPGGAASYGLAQPASVQSTYQAFLSDTAAFPEFAAEFYNEMPFIPLCYRNGVLVHSKNLTRDIQPSASDVFYNITDWQ